MQDSGNNTKVDCAKACPCGVAAIPVPEQFLEIVVIGSFKVWHIIFILMAFAMAVTVFYCCVHRVRIPRTKQEIEADLMRSTLAEKFRSYLQDFANEQITFLEALKKVQEMEEKLKLENDESARILGAKKRMGWLKLNKANKDDKYKQDTNKESANDDNEVKPTSCGPDTVPANGEQVVAEPVIEKAANDQEPAETGEDSATATDAPGEKSGEAPNAPTGKVNVEGASADRGTPAKAAKPARAKRRRKANLARTKGTHEDEQHEPGKLEQATEVVDLNHLSPPPVRLR